MAHAFRGTWWRWRPARARRCAATIAAYGHVRLGHGPVHVITVNDYLARRDAGWMAPVYELLGLTVGSVTEVDNHDERLAAYDYDVTYVSVNEAGFDYLRDQLVTEHRRPGAGRPVHRDRR